MAFSCPAQTSLTDTDLNALYSGGLLPSSFNSGDRDSQGMLTSNVVTSQVSKFQSTGVVPMPDTKTDPVVYATKLATLHTNIKSEYCHYYSRYRAALQKLFASIGDSYTSGKENQEMTQKYLGITQALNRRLNDLTQIVNGIATNMVSTNGDLDQEILSYNEKIQEQRKRLDAQNTILTSNQASMKLKKEMVQYTEEKGRRSDNLLKLYSFMNIVVVGLLVYVYKAAGNE